MTALLLFLHDMAPVLSAAAITVAGVSLRAVFNLQKRLEAAKAPTSPGGEVITDEEKKEAVVQALGDTLGVSVDTKK